MVDKEKMHSFENSVVRPGDCAVCSHGTDDPRHQLPDPFDPHPPAKKPAIDGWIWCFYCESVQPATGHQCAAAL